MTYVYYEPVKDKIYISEYYVGDNPKLLSRATDGEYTCAWHFTKVEYVFHYLGVI